MRIATSWSVAPEGSEAVKAAYQALTEQLGGEPQIVFLHSTIGYDGEVLMRQFHELAPGVYLHGGTSCLGLMTDAGHHNKDGFGLGMLGILDPEGSYGVGVAVLGDDAEAAAATAVRKALDQAGRPGEVPAMVWMEAAPGQEEALIRGVATVLGPTVPVAGGSSADNTVSGGWSQFANGEVYKNAVVLAVMFPSTQSMFAFHSGYEPTISKGKVTKADGRTLYTIDGRPAAEVYNEWTRGAVKDQLAGGGNVLGLTTLFPLGREVGMVGGMPYYQLSHPETVTAEGALTLFTTVDVGEELVLMHGTRESLVSRAGRVAEAALETYSAKPDQIAGALVIYCAGCMLTVQDRVPDVVESLRTSLGGKPFLGGFTFGEQGCFMGGENRHGNLMISVLVLGADNLE